MSQYLGRHAWRRDAQRHWYRRRLVDGDLVHEVVLGGDGRPEVEYAEVRVGRHGRDDVWIRGTIRRAIGTIAHRQRPEGFFSGR